LHVQNSTHSNLSRVGSVCTILYAARLLQYLIGFHAKQMLPCERALMWRTQNTQEHKHTHRCRHAHRRSQSSQTYRRDTGRAKQGTISACPLLNKRERACSLSHATRQEVFVDMRSSLGGQEFDDLEDEDNLRRQAAQHRTSCAVCPVWDAGWGMRRANH
jgi:hypothetical protein